MHLDPASFAVDPALIHTLEAHATPIDCHAECILFRQGDPPVGLYILKSGSATLLMNSAAGSPIISIAASAGSLLGLPGVVGDRPYTLSAIAHPGARVSFLPRDRFLALMKSDPALTVKILQVLAAEVRSARQAII